MSPKGKLHEQGFNYALAKALRTCNPEWNETTVIAERTGARKRFDIEIDTDNMPKVVIECAFEGDGGMDAKARLDNSELKIETAISIDIPNAFERMAEETAAQKLIDGAEIGYAVLQQKDFRFPEQGYLSGNVRDLAAFIQVASVSKDSVERVADEVVELIRGAGGKLSAHLSDTARNKIVQLMSQRSYLNGTQTAAVLWLDAMLVQSKIHKSGDVDINQLPLAHDADPLALSREWRKILQTNWHSIFEPAVDALEVAAREYSPNVSAALEKLVEAVGAINRAKLGSQINVGAELFPKISEDRKQAAAFYTLPATAEFLAHLTIRESDAHKWDAKIFSRIKVADFACGTGTLLRAAVNRIAGFYAAGGGSADGLNRLHRDALECGILGTDVSPVAAHLALSSLVLTGSGKSYARTDIGPLKVGDPDRTGALEYLTSSRQQDMLQGQFQETLSGDGTDDDSDEAGMIVANDNAFDYVLMNPPYSRTRGGQSAFDIADLTDAERNACQERWGKLLDNQEQQAPLWDAPAIKTAGMAASFLCIARRKVKVGGRIGFVLPLTAAFAQSWGKTRAMLVTDFDDIIAITSPRRELKSKVSADTGMGEMLLIAAKRNTANKQPSPVLCVVTDDMPTRVGIAGEYARSIISAMRTMRGEKAYILAADSEIGRMIRFHPQSRDAAWSHLGVRHLELAAMADALSRGELRDITKPHHQTINCSMIKMHELFEIGPGNDLIGKPYGSKMPRGAFVIYPIKDESDVVGMHHALWAAKADEQTKLRVPPTHKGTVFNQKILDAIEKQAGYMHIAFGMQWTSQALIAAATENPVFGGTAWVTLLSDDENLLHAFALYANSIFGALVYWTKGTRTQLGRARLSHSVVKSMPVPDLRQLPADKLQTAAAVFAANADAELLPLCQLHTDANRHKIDRAVAEMLGIDLDESALQAIRRAFCEEPSIHGNNTAALARLDADH